ncbi:MAG: flagellar protein FlaG [Candidatus Hydrogenedentes bacterium]|nr:flagellar protein FlaG [Candidatus Hydrogenedentota bacterium]
MLPEINTQLTYLRLASPDLRSALPAPPNSPYVNMLPHLSEIADPQEMMGKSLLSEEGNDLEKEKLFLEIEIGGKRVKIEIPITSTRLKLDEETKRIVIQILNAKDEVIKQIPPEEWLKFLAKWQKIQGLFFDERA